MHVPSHQAHTRSATFVTTHSSISYKYLPKASLTFTSSCTNTHTTHRYFFRFVISVTIYCLVIFCASVSVLTRQAQIENGYGVTAFIQAVAHQWASAVVVIISFFSVWSLVSL